MFDTPSPLQNTPLVYPKPRSCKSSCKPQTWNSLFKVYFHFQRNGIARVPVLTTRNAATGTHIGSLEPLITFTFILNLVTSKNELQLSTYNEKVRVVLLYIFLGDEIFLDDRLMCRSAVGHSQSTQRSTLPMKNTMPW
jgi:hypothetical protein